MQQEEEKEVDDRSSIPLLARRCRVSVIRDSVRAKLASEKERERKSEWKNNTPPTSTRDIARACAEANFNGQRRNTWAQPTSGEYRVSVFAEERSYP